MLMFVMKTKLLFLYVTSPLPPSAISSRCGRYRLWISYLYLYTLMACVLFSCKLIEGENSWHAMRLQLPRDRYIMLHFVACITMLSVRYSSEQWLLINIKTPTIEKNSFALFYSLLSAWVFSFNVVGDRII